jgi:hypothetical protein
LEAEQEDLEVISSVMVKTVAIFENCFISHPLRKIDMKKTLLLATLLAAAALVACGKKEAPAVEAAPAAPAAAASEAMAPASEAAAPASDAASK